MRSSSVTKKANGIDRMLACIPIKLHCLAQHKSCPNYRNDFPKLPISDDVHTLWNAVTSTLADIDGGRSMDEQ